MGRRGAGLAVAVALAGGCGNDGSNGDVGPAPIALPSIQFATADFSTGTRAARLRIYDDGGRGPTGEVVSAIASKLEVTSWPGGLDVEASLSTLTFPSGEEPSGAQRPGYGQVDVTLDAALDGSGWYRMAILPQPAEYRLPGEVTLFAFADGLRGVRFSPAHVPVVAALQTCDKGGGTVAAYAYFSEPVVNAAGALALDYGATAMTCAVGQEVPSQVQFICENATGGAPFTLRIADGVAAQASGTPMAAATLRSIDMQSAVTNDGCSYYRPTLRD